jgi:transcriptional regulator with XRE-family HTH domain
MNDIGWRVRQLRIAKGLTQSALARMARKHTSYISRLEREEARVGTPKPETINEILDALGATAEERRAIFHEEESALTRRQIDEQIRKIAAEYETQPRAMALLDEHWYRWYFNRIGRELLGLTPEEYERTAGEHVVLHLLDRKSPLYTRYSEQDRATIFSLRAAAFQFHFADQQFDSWYQEIVEQIRMVPWAEHLWMNPPARPALAASQDVTLWHPDPDIGAFNLRMQLNQLMDAPRFTIMELQPRDEETAEKLRWLRESPKPGEVDNSLGEPSSV